MSFRGETVRRLMLRIRSRVKKGSDDLGGGAAAAAQQKLYGYTAEQLAAWRPKFQQKVEGHFKTS